MYYVTALKTSVEIIRMSVAVRITLGVVGCREGLSLARANGKHIRITYENVCNTSLYKVELYIGLQGTDMEPYRKWDSVFSSRKQVETKKKKKSSTRKQVWNVVTNGSTFWNKRSKRVQIIYHRWGKKKTPDSLSTESFKSLYTKEI